MSDQVEPPYVEWIARGARKRVVTDQAARDRVMAAVRAEGALPASPIRRIWARIAEPRSFRLSPAASTLLAAGLVGIGILAGKYFNNWGVPRDGESTTRVAMQPPVSHTTDTVARFYFAGPQASSVSLVGDFNDWDAARTPMVRAGNGGLWIVTLPLKAGRHVYAFVVDGS